VGAPDLTVNIKRATSKGDVWNWRRIFGARILRDGGNFGFGALGVINLCGLSSPWYHLYDDGLWFAVFSALGSTVLAVLGLNLPSGESESPLRHGCPGVVYQVDVPSTADGDHRWPRTQ